MWHLGPRDTVLPQAHSAQVCSSLNGKYSVYSHISLVSSSPESVDIGETSTSFYLRIVTGRSSRSCWTRWPFLTLARPRTRCTAASILCRTLPCSVSAILPASQVITAVTSTWPQACIWWIPFFCFQESIWGCRCCISRVLTSRRVWSGLRQDPWQEAACRSLRLLQHVLSCQVCLWLRQIFKHKILFKINSR